MSEATPTFERVSSPSLFGDVPDKYRGYLDSFDPEMGIEGWALDYENSEEPVTLMLTVADHVVAQCKTEYARGDIAAALGRSVTPGFRFPADTFRRLQRVPSSVADHPIRIRIAGTPIVLFAPFALPSASELRRKRIKASAGAPPDFDLELRLSDERNRAIQLAMQPPSTSAEKSVGCIEGIAIDPAGMVWVLGWLANIGPVDCPAMVDDGQKVPAGFAFTLFSRPDVGEGRHGLLGVLLTNWKPAPNAAIRIFMGGEGVHLHSTGSMRVIPMQEFAGYFNRELPNCHSGHTEALQRLIDRTGNSWAISRHDIAFPARASLDRLLVLPGFGALVSGWALSPAKPIVNYVLRLGASALACDKQSLYLKARPDLWGVLPGADVEKAGFFAAFRGNFSIGDLNAPVIRVIYDDGTFTNHAVDPMVLTRIEPPVGLRTATEFFPSITEELFFPDFAAALRAQAAARAESLRTYAAAPAARAMIFVVPERRSDLFLLLDNIESHLRDLENPPGIVLIADASRSRPEVTALFAALRAGTSAPCSLFIAEDAAYALHLLPDVLSAVRPTGFAFIAGNLFLTGQGWQSALEALEAREPPLTFLEIDSSGAADRDLSVTAECFVWSWAEFDNWITDAKLFLSGFYRDNLLGKDQSFTLRRQAARRSVLPVTPPLIAAVNRLAAEA